MVLVDTDVLLIAFRYQRDVRFAVNSSFLSKVKGEEPCITVYNLMEFLGQMSFNMPSERLRDWDRWLGDEYSLLVVWPEAGDLDANGVLRTEIYDRPFSKMLNTPKGMAFNDALILALAERTADISAVVTWNARHFRDKTGLSVLTPEEYLH
ncbi:MAG: hypothetical protein Q7R39_08460 [Dehalococcoidia bacterium]|nr:hypothetical protein [Dehalococcoidia bacterium]